MSTSYDLIAYPCSAQTQTHPDLLAALASLHGLDPAPIDRCEVLEIGCNDGSNLIPMAANEPDSHFTGIDLAQTAITAASGWSERLGLTNIEFARADVLDWKPDGRSFDYIIAHGVYSWVPPQVREALLNLCRTSLNPNGVAYISYNALPGCHFRRYVWDLLRFHTRGLEDPRERIAAAREISTKMCSWMGNDSQPLVIKEELERILTVHDSVLLHDDLAEWNTPFYLSEFVADAERHGLQYLCDARFSRDSFQTPGLDGKDWLTERQYADFTTVRRFRSSLLCQAETKPAREARSERLFELQAASPAEPQPEQHDGTQTFKLGDEKSLSTNHPAAKRLLAELGSAWPLSRRVADLPVESLSREEAAALVLRLFEGRAIELRGRPPRLVSTVSERPVASPLSRLQIANGQISVTNQRHVGVVLTDDLTRDFIMLLDGTRDRAALLRDLLAQFDSGKTLPAWHANGPADRLEIALMLDKSLDANLAQVARLGLLVK